jgi:lactoylglutathione lyase
MNKPGIVDAGNKLMGTGYSHIAFSVKTKEELDSLTEKIRSDGYEIISGPRTTGDGYYESCFIDIEDNQIEIAVEN